jgi:hypothetical protein
MNKVLGSIAVACSLLAGQAVAQTASPQSANKSEAKPANYQEMRSTWRSSKLIGLNVFNNQNEKIGDINELVVGKDGKIAFAIVGVGGFLGMGEHDIAVPLDKLKFVEDAVRPSNTTSAKTETTPARTDGNAKSTSATSYDWVPDHAVMSGTKEELKALPEFKYSNYN